LKADFPSELVPRGLHESSGAKLTAAKEEQRDKRMSCVPAAAGDARTTPAPRALLSSHCGQALAALLNTSSVAS
jgi:hypothetical protein